MNPNRPIFRTGVLRFLLTAVIAWGVLPQTTAAQTSSRPVIYTVNYPLQYFASRLTGDLARVEFPAPADVDPAYWTPGEVTLLAYQQADLILLNGANYAHWLTAISLPINSMVDTSDSASQQYIYSGDVTTHAHGPSGQHSHESLASTTWLDLSIAVEQASNIAKALIRLMPDHEDILEQNLDDLTRELNLLDSDLQRIGDAFGDSAILASHPVYQYLSRRYRLNMQSVHWEPEEVQPLSEWQHLELLLEKFPAKWMIWEKPPMQETIDTLARLGVAPLVVYTLANRPEQGDFMSVMHQNVETLKRITENR